MNYFKCLTAPPNDPPAGEPGACAALVLLSTRDCEHFRRGHIGGSYSAHDKSAAWRVVMRQRKHSASIACREHPRPRGESHRLEGETLRRIHWSVAAVRDTDHEDQTGQRDDGSKSASARHQRSWRERHGVNVEDLRRGEGGSPRRARRRRARDAPVTAAHQRIRTAALAWSGRA